MSTLQGTVRVFCSDLLQLVYLLILVSDLQLLYLIRPKAPCSALPSCLLQAVLGGAAQPRGPLQATVPDL